MKAFSGLRMWLCAVVLVLLAGCATPRVDWNSRVGNYTFDQAITELGPPDKQATMSDGRRVAEWISRYYNGSTAVVSGGMYPGGVGVIQTAPSYYESRLRLTFTTNNLLAAWSKH